MVFSQETSLNSVKQKIIEKIVFCLDNLPENSFFTHTQLTASVFEKLSRLLPLEEVEKFKKGIISSRLKLLIEGLLPKITLEMLLIVGLSLEVFSPFWIGVLIFLWEGALVIGDDVSQEVENRTNREARSLLTQLFTDYSEDFYKHPHIHKLHTAIAEGVAIGESKINPHFQSALHCLIMSIFFASTGQWALLSGRIALEMGVQKYIIKNSILQSAYAQNLSEWMEAQTRDRATLGIGLDDHEKSEEELSYTTLRRYRLLREVLEKGLLPLAAVSGQAVTSILSAFVNNSLSALGSDEYGVAFDENSRLNQLLEQLNNPISIKSRRAYDVYAHGRLQRSESKKPDLTRYTQPFFLVPPGKLQFSENSDPTLTIPEWIVFEQRKIYMALTPARKGKSLFLKMISQQIQYDHQDNFFIIDALPTDIYTLGSQAHQRVKYISPAPFHGEVDPRVFYPADFLIPPKPKYIFSEVHDFMDRYLSSTLTALDSHVLELMHAVMRGTLTEQKLEKMKQPQGVLSLCQQILKEYQNTTIDENSIKAQFKYWLESLHVQQNADRKSSIFNTEEVEVLLHCRSINKLPTAFSRAREKLRIVGTVLSAHSPAVIAIDGTLGALPKNEKVLMYQWLSEWVKTTGSICVILVDSIQDKHAIQHDVWGGQFFFEEPRKEHGVLVRLQES